MILSVLVCSTHNRYNNVLLNVLSNLFAQIELLPIKTQNQVEVIALIDNKKIMLGDKRNDLVNMAQGEYVVFVDDDDRVEKDYISSLLEAATTDPDVIVFNVSVSINGNPPKICLYSKDFEKDMTFEDKYLRLPNHLCCTKKELAMQVKFLPIKYGEDADYSKRLKPLLKTQVEIDRVLYHYDFNSLKTETQEQIKRRR